MLDQARKGVKYIAGKQMLVTANNHGTAIGCVMETLSAFPSTDVSSSLRHAGPSPRVLIALHNLIQFIYHRRLDKFSRDCKAGRCANVQMSGLFTAMTNNFIPAFTSDDPVSPYIRPLFPLPLLHPLRQL